MSQDLTINKYKTYFFFKSGRWDIETSSGLIVRLPNKNFKKSLELEFNILKTRNVTN